MPHLVNADLQCETAVGDFDTGFGSAAVKIDQRYTTPYQFSQPMEPNACLAVPRGDDLIIYVSAQIVDAARTSIASTLRMDPQRIQVIAPYVGGGFGSKLGIHSETILAAIAARLLKKPVKVVLTRQQIFHLMGVRPTTSQRVRLGAGRDGRLIAIAHEVNMYTSPHAEFAEQTAATTRALYAAPNRLTNHWLTPLDLPRGEDVRAPGEAPGLLAVESAMDELAYALGMDPIELRIKNEPKVASRDRRAVQRTASGRVHARRSAAFRLGSAPGAAREPAGGPVAGRLWHGSRDPHALPRTGKGEGADGAGRDRRRPIGHDRHWRRHLHDSDAGRGRGSRAADRSRAGRARAFRLSAQLGLRRIVGRRQFEHRGLPRVPGAAREAGGVGVQRREVPVARAGPPGSGTLGRPRDDWRASEGLSEIVARNHPGGLGGGG